MSFFARESVPARYARYRPHFHPKVVDHIRSYLKLIQPFEKALDVGCGTGQSTVALKEIATEIVGVDVSSAMLSMSKPEPRIDYVQASAEALPFPAASFNLITTALAFHWFDHDRFLSEAHRVLVDDGWLMIYNNSFRGQMIENEEFLQWFKAKYLARFPTPPRNSQPISREKWERNGFRFVHEEEYQNEISFTVDQLAAYLTTQSNIVAAVEQGPKISIPYSTG